MTRRERLQRKVDRRQEWAISRRAESERRYDTGPWDLSRDGTPDYAPQFTVYDAATGKRVATVFDAEHTRLIAAALELRDLLATAIKVLDADGILYGDTGDDTEPLDVLREARALLARIDGEG